jgi:hypothetical protein
MLAPFTAGWQSNDLDPLVIEKSEVYTSCDKSFLFDPAYLLRQQSKLSFFPLNYITNLKLLNDTG